VIAYESIARGLGGQDDGRDVSESKRSLKTPEQLGEKMKTFWDYVARGDGCWLWTGAQRKGYGTVKRAGKQQGAHRVAYSMVNGEIPAGQVVRHKCHTPLCVRPDHLQLGTTADNNEDRRRLREAKEQAQLDAILTSRPS
jgi:hypothetical protein